MRAMDLSSVPQDDFRRGVQVERFDDRGSSRGFRICSSIALAYILLRPVGYPEIFLPTLGFLGLSSLFAVLFGRRRLSLEVGWVVILLITLGFYGAIFRDQNPGLSSGLLVWCIAPMIFGSWAMAADEKMLQSVFVTICWSTIVLSSIVILFVLSQLGIVPSLIPAWLIEESGAGFAIDEGTTAIRLLGLSTLVAAAPMWLVSIFAGDSPVLPSRRLRILAAGLASIAGLMGGRNAIVVVLVLVPTVYVVVRAARLRIRSVRFRPGAWFALFSLPVLGYVAFQLLGASSVVARTWSTIGDFISDSGQQSVRRTQVVELMRAWSNSPLFGEGWGAVIQGYARSAERPWNFEMQYFLILFQVGIVGYLFLVCVGGVSVLAIVRAAKARPDLRPAIITASAACLAMLVADATNPYLQAPGHMWSVWLILMVANVALTSTPGDPSRKRAPSHVPARRLASTISPQTE